MDGPAHLNLGGSNLVTSNLTEDRDRDAAVILKTYKILQENRVTVTGKDGRIHTFTTPSKTDGAGNSHLDYGGKQWLWDSAAHVMNLAHTEPEIAKAELKAVFAHQNTNKVSKDFGFVPHMNYFHEDGQKLPEWAREHLKRFLDSIEGRQMVPQPRRTDFMQTYWSSPVHSDITQPPIVGMAALEVLDATQDKEFAKEMLPSLTAYYDYLHDRRADNDGLLRIVHPWESGWDNSQRWDVPVGLGKQTGSVKRSRLDEKKMRLFCKYKALDWSLDKIFESEEFSVKPVDFNALYVKSMECVAKVCEALSDTKQATRYRKRATQVKEAIFEKMWDGDKYTDLVAKNGEESLSSVKSAAMFYPMMLGGEPRSGELISRHLSNPDEFNPENGYSVPTTSLDDPSVPKNLLEDPNDHYWRGNIWVIVNFFVRCGVEQHLKNKPDDLLARSMSEKIRTSTFEALHRADFFEYFHPIPAKGEMHGQGFGVPSFGWNGLATFMNKKPAFLR
jgi:glycogen debranching enzyme